MPIVKPIHVIEGTEVVDIHWHLKTGTIHIERISAPIGTTAAATGTAPTPTPSAPSPTT